MSGCATSSLPAHPAFCDTARPIYIGQADTLTDKTADQILAHNLTGRQLCDWGNSKKRKAR